MELDGRADTGQVAHRDRAAFLVGGENIANEKITTPKVVLVLVDDSTQQQAAGKKRPGLAALQMAHNAIKQGARGVDMGRNIFQSDAPKAMLQAVRAVVHDGQTPSAAFDLYKTLESEG